MSLLFSIILFNNSTQLWQLISLYNSLRIYIYIYFFFSFVVQHNNTIIKIKKKKKKELALLPSSHCPTFHFHYLTLKVCLDTIYFTENWKYYNKINFKYVNNTMRLIFNESFVKKKVCVSRKQCTRPTEKATTLT